MRICFSAVVSFEVAASSAHLSEDVCCELTEAFRTALLRMVMMMPQYLVALRVLAFAALSETFRGRRRQCVVQFSERVFTSL